MASHVTQITDRKSHEEVVEDSKSVPTVIYVSHPSTPVCRTFTPKYEALAAKYADKSTSPAHDVAEKNLRFCQMDFNRETSMLYKFSPNQLPVVSLMCNDRWAKTIMGANISEVEAAVEELLKWSGKFRN